MSSIHSKSSKTSSNRSLDQKSEKSFKSETSSKKAPNAHESDLKKIEYMAKSMSISGSTKSLDKGSAYARSLCHQKQDNCSECSTTFTSVSCRTPKSIVDSLQLYVNRYKKSDSDVPSIRDSSNGSKIGSKAGSMCSVRTTSSIGTKYTNSGRSSRAGSSVTIRDDWKVAKWVENLDPLAETPIPTPIPTKVLMDDTIKRIEMNNIIDKRLDKLDPNPDIQVLFKEYDLRYFNGVLTANDVECVWSDRMYVSGGITYDMDDKGRPITIRLSRKLLQFAKRSHLVETLLHEMIHAFMYALDVEDSGEHGPIFKELMNELNRKTGAKINIYHDIEYDECHFNRKCEEMRRNKGKGYNRLCEE